MQGCFGFYRDLPERPRRPERLFFGLLPDPETAGRAVRLADRFIRDRRLAGRPLRRDRLHVSLHHVGDYTRLKSRFLFAASRAAEAVSMHPFELTFRRIGGFEGPPLGRRPGARPLVLFADGGAVAGLHARLGAAMERCGLRAGPGLTPHMTLFYGAETVPVEPVEPIRFAVGDFVLIHSALGLGRYTVVERWPLAG